MAEFCGLMVKDVSVGAVTVKVAVPLTPGALAVIVVVPWAVAGAVPAFVESPLTGATVVDEELQRTDASGWVLPLLNVPATVKDCCAPTPMDGVAGATAMLTKPLNW